MSTRVETAFLWRSSDFGVIRIKRLAELAQHLPAQDVEIVGRGAAVGHLQIVLGAQLQIALQPGRRVLRPLALVAVRQKHGQARHTQPLALAGGDELVDQHLGAVGEIAELSLPKGQGPRLGQGKAVLEAQHRHLRQRRVQGFEVSLARAQVTQWRVVLFGGLIDDVAMALDEGAAHAVLARRGGPGSPGRAGWRRPGARRSPSRCSAPDWMLARRPSMTRLTVRWTSIRSGMAVNFSPRSVSFCLETAVSPAPLLAFW